MRDLWHRHRIHLELFWANIDAGRLAPCARRSIRVSAMSGGFPENIAARGQSCPCGASALGIWCARKNIRLRISIFNLPV
jgi:hypothetical protein